MWEWLIPAIAAVGSAVINLFSTKSTNDTLTQNQEKQNQFNKQMLDEQNAYNSPSNQKKLYNDAGINPGFLFGGLSGLDSTSGSIQSAGAPNLQPPQLDGQGIANTLFEKKRLQNETLKNEADIREIIEKSESYKIANNQAEERFQLEKNKLLSETGLTDAERHLKETQLETEKLHQQEVFYNAENLRYNLSLIEEKRNTEKWTQAHYEAVINRMIHLTPFEAQNLASQSNLNNEQSKVAAETLNKIQQEVVNMVKQGEQIDAVTLGQVIRNKVDNIKSYNEISSELLLAGSPVINAIYQNCGGMIGDLVKSIGAFSLGATSPESKESHASNVRHAHSFSSWLYTK